MGMAYYVGSLPASEIKDGHVHLTVDDGTGIVTTIHVYQQFIERERDRLIRFNRENRPSEPIPLYAGCRDCDRVCHMRRSEGSS